MRKLVLLLIIILLLLTGCFPEYSSSTNPYSVQTYDQSSVSSPIYVQVMGLMTENGTMVYGVLPDGTKTDINGLLVGDGSNISGLIPPGGALVGTTASQTLSNKSINAGSDSLAIATTGLLRGVNITSTQDGASGARIMTYQDSASPAVNDQVGLWEVRGKGTDSGVVTYGIISIYTENVTAGQERGMFKIRLCTPGDVQNIALTLSSEGVLAVDDSFDTFDEYDDADLLRRGISKGDRELLKSVDVLIEKRDEDNRIIPGKYQIQLQALLKLVSGGIYQNRDKIDALNARISALEARETK